MSVATQLFGALASKFDELVSMARATSNENLADALFDVGTFFRDLYNLGENAEAAFDDPDTNAVLRVLGPVDIHLDAMSAATRFQLAA